MPPAAIDWHVGADCVGEFSPDGTKLAVTGGLPARMGEVQIWDVASRQLELSLPVTFDTVYGASWSPDGKLLAFGCTDNTVRAIDATTGEQVLYQGAHSDWALDTVFSADGSHLASVGRDATAKLIEVATQRFVDNITSITPGASARRDQRAGAPSRSGTKSCSAGPTACPKSIVCIAPPSG